MAGGDSLIKKRRRLADLYKRGIEVRVGGRYGLDGAIATDRDGEDVPEHLRAHNNRFDVEVDESEDSTEIAMWVQPPSPLNREQALRDANAARARAMMVAKSDKDSMEYLSAMEFISEMSEETLYEYVLLSETEQRRQDALREILAEEEWSDITELQESLRIFEEENRSEDDPEVKAVRAREEQLAMQVAERERDLRDSSLEVLKMRGVEHARQQAAEKRSDLVGSQAFMKEYERHMRFYAVRDPESHATFFFESAMDLADQPEEIQMLVDTAIGEFIRDGAEAKNSPRAEPGSTSSGPPSKQETSESSTPQESIA